MPSNKPQFVIRADKEILEKISYIAKENERNTTQEIVYLIKQRIKAYEQENGEIILPQKPTAREAWDAEKELLKNPTKSKMTKLKESAKHGFDFGNADKLK